MTSSERLAESFAANPDQWYLLFRALTSPQKPFWLRSEIWDIYTVHCEKNTDSVLRVPQVETIFRSAQEAAVGAPWIYLAIRPQVARWEYLRIHVESMQIDSITVNEFLRFKESLVGGGPNRDEWILEFDLQPFNRDFPKLKESRSIGRGVEFLNRRLSSQLFQDGVGNQRLLEFLSVHQYKGQQLMLNSRISGIEPLRQRIRLALEYLATCPGESVWDDVCHRMQEYGFEPGWGRTVARMSDSLSLLSDLLEAPEPIALERFLRRIPMIFNMAILSPHGYFGQANVLGLPDTGGQVVYILDQVRALEREMRTRLHEQGLEIDPSILVITRLIPESPSGTTCDQPSEPIVGTKYARILRVPFRTESGEIVPHWISRFEIWPYLERFAFDVGRELLAEFGGRPDLVVGNYSDGNLVASLLAHRLGVTQCNIAHALEKTKYLMSDLYWKENDAQYHFACQFTADLIAMNAADFIIASTYQEIAGRQDGVGQYESYSSFTLPGLYRVAHGVDMFDPKFNIVSPGADAEVYFPYSETNRRRTALHDELNAFLFADEPRPDARGRLVAPDKPILFSMARLDHIKNLTGLVEWFGRSEALRSEANLVIVGGSINPAASADREEQDQITRMHSLMDQYGLDGNMRWLGARLEKNFAGELYRCIADKKGAFVQPALFEAFGLTVIEAMASGLPTFATCYGGPLEIIVDGVSGFHIDPNYGEAAAKRMADFFANCRADPQYWQRMSHGAIRRVEERYTWALYAERMMTLSRIYGFWKYVTNLERDETRRYLEMFYGLMFRPLAKTMAVENR